MSPSAQQGPVSPEGPASADGLAVRGARLLAGDRELFATLSLAVAPGEVLAVTGPSGAGKSSLLAFICGVLPPPLVSHGEVWLGGVNVSALPPERRRIGILFQDDLLFPHLSVRGNLAFGLRADAGTRSERQRRVSEALASVGLPGYEERDPASLSGGERARVALLRVLLSEPKAIVLDEPFSKLDPVTRESVRSLVLQRCRALALPTLLVTHDAGDVAAAGGRCIELHRRADDLAGATDA